MSFLLVRSFNGPAKIPKTGNLKKVSVEFQIRNAHTHYMFDELPHTDLFYLNAELASHVRNNNALATWSLFRRMHSECLNLNAYTFTPVLVACSSLQCPKSGKQVHGLMIKLGIVSGTVTRTALLVMYSKYGYLGDSVKVFEEIEFKDVVTWNALLSSFLRNGLGKEALGVFEAMRMERVELSEFTLCSVLKACAILKGYRQGKQVHGLVVVMGRDLVVLGTALIDFYSNVGHIGESMKVFSCLYCRKDEVMLNALLSGCVQNRKYEEAFMIMSSIRPNIVALTSVLAACSENSDLWVGKQIHCVAIRFGLTSDTQLCNVLLDMYAKCGKLLTARSLFNEICLKDVITWTSMIDAYGSHGNGPEALEIFEKMGEKGSGTLPNCVTFLAVLSACGHSGLVEEGRKCFSLMRDNYGFDPGPEHYACFIDILGRAGQVEEMWSLFEDMIKNGTGPTAAVWAALLNACSLNMDVSRGEFAAKNLLELEPNKPGNYVLLSNFYAAIGRWDWVDNFRSIMKTKGLLKEQGSSWVAVVDCPGNAINLSKNIE